MMIISQHYKKAPHWPGLKHLVDKCDAENIIALIRGVLDYDDGSKLGLKHVTAVFMPKNEETKTTLLKRAPFKESERVLGKSIHVKKLATVRARYEAADARFNFQVQE